MRFGGLGSMRLGKLPSIPWRRFAGELVTIILGVFLALVGQEWLNDRFERKQLHFTEQDLRHEVIKSAQSAYMRLAIRDCLRDELTNLTAALNRDGDRWEPVKRNFANPPIDRALQPVFEAPVRPWNSAAWDTAIASNSLTFMPIERVINYVHVYEAIEKIRELQNAEFDSGSRLSLLSVPRRIDPRIRADLLAEVGRVDANAALIANISDALLFEASSLGSVLTAEERAGFVQRVASATKVRGKCVNPPPLGL